MGGRVRVPFAMVNRVELRMQLIPDAAGGIPNSTPPRVEPGWADHPGSTQGGSYPPWVTRVVPTHPTVRVGEHRDQGGSRVGHPGYTQGGYYGV